MSDRLPPNGSTGMRGRPVSKLRTINETAEILNVSGRTVRRLIASGALPVHRFRRLVRISDEAIRELLAANSSECAAVRVATGGLSAGIMVAATTGRSGDRVAIGRIAERAGGPRGNRSLTRLRTTAEAGELLNASRPAVGSNGARAPPQKKPRTMEPSVVSSFKKPSIKELFAMKPAIPARVNPYGQPDGEGKFKPGNPGGPGRPKGSRNKVGTDLKAMILNAAMRTGFIKIDESGNRIGTGVDGCEGFLMWLCLYEPRTFAGLFARILPYYITSDVLPPVASRAEIEAEFRELGLPMELINFLEPAPAPLDPGEDPDPWGLHKKDATPEEASGTS